MPRNLLRSAAQRVALVLICLGAYLSSACSKSDNAKSPNAAKLAPAASPDPRIVVLSPALAVIARDVGLAPFIVGRHGYDLALDRSIPVCGDFAGIDYEALLNTRPTHVLIDWGSRPLPDRLESLGKTNVWRIEKFSALTLDEIRSTVRRFSEIFPQSAPAAANVLTEADRAWNNHAEALDRVGSVLILHGVSPPTALGPGSFHHQLLAAVGGKPALETGGPYMELDAEDLVRLDPGGIVIINARAPDAPGRTSPFLTTQEGATLFGEKLAPNLRAVRNGRVAVLDDPLSLLPSTSMIQLADQLHAVLREWNNSK